MKKENKEPGLTPEEKTKAYQRAYRQSAHGKAVRQRVKSSPEAKAARSQYNARYCTSKAGKAATAKYRSSAKAKATRTRYVASAKGQLALLKGREKLRQKNAPRLAPLKGKTPATPPQVAPGLAAKIDGREPMRRAQAKEVWRALSKRYGAGTLAEIFRLIEWRVGHAMDQPEVPVLRQDLLRCARAINAIGAEYPTKGKPAPPAAGRAGSQRQGMKA